MNWGTIATIGVLATLVFLVIVIIIVFFTHRRLVMAAINIHDIPT